MKRATDVALAGIACILTLPLMMLIALAILVTMGLPVLYHQWRPGLGGRPFRLIKFRTMTEAVDADGQVLPDAERLTPLGRFLRRTSLDELPELFNVLRGDMSLVGPRPLLVEYLPLYTEQQARRHDVRPGLTGLAQLKGRNTVSWEKRFELDVWYVDNRSMRLDLLIILRTIRLVVSGDGISQEGHATVDRFRGNMP